MFPLGEVSRGTGFKRGSSESILCRVVLCQYRGVPMESHVPFLTSHSSFFSPLPFLLLRLGGGTGSYRKRRPFTTPTPPTLQDGVFLQNFGVHYYSFLPSRGSSSGDGCPRRPLTMSRHRLTPEPLVYCDRTSRSERRMNQDI